jgi:hypothetical protein
MKNSNLLFSIFAVLFFMTSCQQDAGIAEVKVQAKKVIEIQYLGPRNTDELKTVLASSKDEVISSLDAPTKESLIKNMVFSEGLFRGMKAKDVNIQKLYESNFSKVLSALLQMNVVENNHPVKNEYRAVFGSRSENVDGIKYQKPIVASYCSNCKVPVVAANAGEACCEVGGDGCSDFRFPDNPTK